MPTRVTFIGAGEIGSSIARLVRASGAKVEQWDKDPAKVPKQKPLEEIVPGSDVIFMCVASWHLRDAIAEIRSLLSKKTIVVSLSKGIERGSKLTVDGLLADTLPKGQPFALLSGPMLAEELDLNLPGAAVVATKKPESYRQISALFKKSTLRLEHVTDLRGTALTGVLKNIYALALGISDALELGSNAKGWLVQQGLVEMMGVVYLLSPKSDAPAAALSPSGVGDLIATGFSHYSSNFTVGREIVAGVGIKKMSEGFISLPSLLSLLGPRAKMFPLLQTLKAIVIGKKNAKKEYGTFLKAS